MSQSLSHIPCPTTELNLRMTPHGVFAMFSICLRAFNSFTVWHKLFALGGFESLWWQNSKNATDCSHLESQIRTDLARVNVAYFIGCFTWQEEEQLVSLTVLFFFFFYPPTPPIRLFFLVLIACFAETETVFALDVSLFSISDSKEVFRWLIISL